MEKHNNISLFINYKCDNKIPLKLKNLLRFTSLAKLVRDKILTFNNKRDANFGDYIFMWNNKEYPFSVFSDLDISKYDKTILRSTKRNYIMLERTLKIACSYDFINPQVSIGYSEYDPINLLIIFEDQGITKVVDYSKNIIMKKDDYHDIFNYHDWNILDKVELYNIYYMLSQFNEWNNAIEYLLFSKEIFRELASKEQFKFFSKNYDSNGIHENNYIIFGNEFDSLFFCCEDYSNTHKQAIEELDDFTERPLEKTWHISYDKGKDCFRANFKGMDSFTFRLLSDMVSEQDIKEELLSDRRYHKCHINSVMVASGLEAVNKSSAYVVAGSFKVNDKDGFSHSWVEIDDSDIVIDYNHNIIMNREKYYKLFEIEVLSKTLINELLEIIDILIFEADLDLHEYIINVFGKELLADINKNINILQKKKGI